MLTAFYLLCTMAYGFDITIDGINYSVDTSTGTAKVVCVSNPELELYDSYLTIPSSIEYVGNNYLVTSIGSRAFDNLQNLKAVTISDGILDIGFEAFVSCSQLSNVSIPSSVMNVDMSAFNGTPWLNNQPDGVIYAGLVAYVYKGEMPEHTSISFREGTKSIGNWLFHNCTNLTSVTIPESVIAIGENTFKGCTNLIDVEINCPFVDAWFAGNTSLQEVFLGDKVMTIGDGAFIGCAGLRVVTFPKGLTSIGKGAFMGCQALTSLSIPQEIHNIEDEAFMDCSGLVSLNIPEGIATIGQEAFKGCLQLNSLILPSSLTSIGPSAFSFCQALSSLAIPSSVKSIGREAFSSCTGLADLMLSEGVENIETDAFSGCSSLTEVIIPSTVTKIGSHAFSWCINVHNIILQEGIKTIGAHTFAGCKALENVLTPSSLKFIGEGAFYDCSNLKEFVCLAEIAPSLGENVFMNARVNSATLYMPISGYEGYRADSQWSLFGKILTLDGEDPEKRRCAKPTISYRNGHLSFTCDTEDVEFISEIQSSDIGKNNTSDIDLTLAYTITVYATRESYLNSETAIATLCWIDAEPQTEGIVDDAVSVKEVKATPVLIQSFGSQLLIGGAPKGSDIAVYDLKGHQITSTKAGDGETCVTVNTNEHVLLIKVGDQVVKVAK